MRQAGNYEGAGKALKAALDICCNLGYRGGEAEVLDETGTLALICGEHEQASEVHREALNLSYDIGSPWDEAHALAGLSRCALAASRTADAQADLRQALEIFQGTSAAEAAGVAGELDALTHA